MFPVLKRKLCCAVIAGNGSLDGVEVFIVEFYFHSYGNGREGGSEFEKGRRTIPRGI
jgi:hypothetical protein